MDFEDIASEIHRIITGRKENKHAVKQMAEILGKSQQTVYDCLYGRIKINLDDFVKSRRCCHCECSEAISVTVIA